MKIDFLIIFLYLKLTLRSKLYALHEVNSLCSWELMSKTHGQQTADVISCQVMSCTKCITSLFNFLERQLVNYFYFISILR